MPQKFVAIWYVSSWLSWSEVLKCNTSIMKCTYYSAYTFNVLYVISTYTYVCTYIPTFSFPFCSTATESLRHWCSKSYLQYSSNHCFNSCSSYIITITRLYNLHLEVVKYIIKHLILIKYSMLFNYIKVANNVVNTLSTEPVLNYMYI